MAWGTTCKLVPAVMGSMVATRSPMAEMYSVRLKSMTAGWFSRVSTDGFATTEARPRPSRARSCAEKSP
ncbi:hypothetical protein D3C78_1853630 [compost metagenome]